MKKLLKKWAGPLFSVSLLYSGAVPIKAAAPTLVAYWDFNNASDPAKTLDKVYGFEGALENGAAFTAAGDGRTGSGTDRAMDFGPDSSQQLVRISKVPFLNFAAANNSITISFWLKLNDIANSSAFWGVSPSSNNGERGIQAHTPWSDSNIYFDHAGCCDAGVQRINKAIPDDLDVTTWHHLAFVKNGNVKQVWIDGTLFLDGAGTAPLPTDFTRLMLGADNVGGNSLHGLEDDFAVYAGALDATAIAALASGTAPDKVPGITVAAGPLIGGAVATPVGFTVEISEPPTSPIQANSVTLKLDGAVVTASAVTKTGNTTTARYDLPAGTYFPSGSAHTLEVSVKDAQGATVTGNRDFAVVQYKLLSAATKVTPDTSKRGFIWNVTQNDALQATDNVRPEQQLAGLLIDSTTGAPYDNLADPGFTGVAIAPGTPGPQPWSPIKFEIETVINVSQVEGENNGNFTPDQGMPGIGSDLNGIAAEILTYLELPAGLTVMGVNSDDGFRTVAGQPLDAFQGVQLGSFDSGRGAADTIFYFVAPEAGVYPFRTVWEEGGGGANIEWFTVKPDGTKVLVNDTAKGGIKAYRAATTSLKPYIRSVTPGPGPRQLNIVSSSLQIVLSDGTTEKVDDSSPVLKLDGKTLTTTKQRTGSTLTLTYQPDGLQIPSERHTAELSFNGTAGSTRTESWTFLNLKSLILPTPKLLDTFDSYPQDSQPTGWTAWNFTSRCDEGRDITSQTSESYENWVLTDVSNISSIDGGRPFNITPGQFIQINGQRVELMNADPPEGTFPQWIMSGNVLYAESDSRCNTDSRGGAPDFPNAGQTQFITTKAYDFSSYQGVVMTFSSIYEQNQDSMGAVEYSVDGGKTWLPVMYFLEEPDIRLKADGSVDAVATFNAANSDTSSWVDNGVKKGGKYGDGLGAAITDDLSLYVVPRVNDGQVEGKRVEIARLDKATGKSDVRLRFAAMGTDSWYFAIDNLAFYDIAGAVMPPSAITVSAARNGANLVVTWTGGNGPFKVQTASALGGAWTDNSTTSERTASVPIGATGALFVRVAGN